MFTKSWYPAILNVFYEGARRKEWSHIPTERMENFFKTIELIMSDQLRYILQNSLADFLDLYNPTSMPLKAQESKYLSFTVKLILNEQAIEFDPPLADLKSTIENILDSLLVAADRVPKVETQLFTNGQNISGGSRALLLNAKAEYCIGVFFESTFPLLVLSSREKFRENLQLLLQKPQDYLSSFENVKSLIDKSAYAEVDEFLLTEPAIDKMIEVHLVISGSQNLKLFEFLGD